MYRESFGISAEKYAGPFAAGIITVACFRVCEICLKMSSPIHLKYDLTIIFILPPFPGRGISRFLALIAVAKTLLISTNS